MILSSSVHADSKIPFEAKVKWKDIMKFKVLMFN